MALIFKYIRVIILSVLFFFIIACQSNRVGGGSLLPQADMSENPQNAQIETLLKESKLHQANLLIDSLLAKNPDDAYLHNFKGLTLARMDKLHEGLKELDRAIALKPDFPESYYNKGLIWYKFQDKVKARQFFDQALALNPKYADVYYQRGVLNFQEFKKDSACVDWTRAINLGYEDKHKYYDKFCK